MLALSAARLMVAIVPFKLWRHRLGGPGSVGASQPAADPEGFAADVESAAIKLPFNTKCLPRAMALSWMLRSRGIGHCLVFAVRPAKLRGAEDQLHAWVEVSGNKILGDLPGSWVETLRLGHDLPKNNVC